MLSLRVVEHLDVVERISPRVVSGFVGFAPDTFALQGIEEAFPGCVVVAVPPQLMLRPVEPPVMAGRTFDRDEN